MTHYIVINENEIVKAEMERPETHPTLSERFRNAGEWDKYNKHIASLPRIPIEGKHDWEVWQSVEKGKDFIFIERCCVEFHVLGVSECESSDDDDNPCKCSVAIPIQPTPEPKKEIDLVEMQKRFDEALTDESVQEYINKYPERFKSQPTPEGDDKFIPPDHGDVCWNIGAETFTRKEVAYLLWTQRAMIGNDLKASCGNDMTKEMFAILDKPRKPVF